MTTNFMAQFDTVANSEQGAKLHFKLPTGELAFIDADKETPKKPVTVTMLGASSDKHKKYSINALRDYRIKSKKSHGKKKDEDISDDFFEETSASQVSRLMAVVTGWENMFDESGKALDCTPDNIKFLFGKYQELRVQAINFLDSDVNFIKS